MKLDEKTVNKEKQALIIRKYQRYLKLEKALSANTLDAYLTDLDKLLRFLEAENIDMLSVTRAASPPVQYLDYVVQLAIGVRLCPYEVLAQCVQKRHLLYRLVQLVRVLRDLPFLLVAVLLQLRYRPLQ